MNFGAPGLAYEVSGVREWGYHSKQCAIDETGQAASSLAVYCRIDEGRKIFLVSSRILPTCMEQY